MQPLMNMMHWMENWFAGKSCTVELTFIATDINNNKYNNNINNKYNDNKDIDK